MRIDEPDIAIFQLFDFFDLDEPLQLGFEMLLLAGHRR
jgi:hypothetical protein